MLYETNPTLICERKNCINEKVTKRYCRDCQDAINKKSKEKRLKRKQNGQCRQCNCKRMETTSYCLYHYLKRIAASTAHDSSLGPALFQKFLNQHKQCFYSGVELQLGVNASLDHAHCQSRHKHWKSDIDNLVWTTKYINSAKTNMEFDEFLTMCEMVAMNSKNIRKIYDKNT